MPLKDDKERAAYNKKWAKENKDKRKDTADKYRESNRQVLRDRSIRSKYKITAIEYDLLFKESPICELCNINKSVHLDHDHTTGKIRGVLCQTCNTGLGKLGDNIQGLLKALNYLEERS